jgi:hypothetical protein
MTRLGPALATLALLAGCSHAALPSDSAPPDVVLDAYLRALKAGDCATTHALGTSTFVVGNGELCGALELISYAISTPPARPRENEVVFGTLETTRGGDGSVPEDPHVWFYDLERQPSGAWRITGGGSGP